MRKAYRTTLTDAEGKPVDLTDVIVTYEIKLDVEVIIKGIANVGPDKELLIIFDASDIRHPGFYTIEIKVRHLDDREDTFSEAVEINL